MRIALISHDIVSGDGQGRVNVELARHLLAHGVEVDLLADRVDDDLVTLGATWVPIHPGGRSINLLRVWKFKRMVDRYLDAHAGRYDVVVACGVVLSRSHTVNVAHFVHGTWVHSPYHPARRHRGLQRWYYSLYGWLNARWETAVWRQTSVVVAVSENVAQDVIALGIESERVVVIPNGVEPTEFAPGPSERSRFGLPETPVLGLFAGDIRSPIKNLDTALRALALTPEVHLAVAGTKDGSPYPALATEWGVADRVHFLGFQTEVAALMRSADFFVLPSHQDAFGLVVTEAMATGLPVVVSRTVGASCLVTPETGIVISPPDDASALAAAFERLASSSALRHSMGRAARSCAEDYSWNRLGERYLDLFHQLAASSASSVSSSPSPPLSLS